MRDQGVLRDLREMPDEIRREKVGLITCAQHHVDIACHLKAFYLSGEIYSMPLFGGLPRASRLHPGRADKAFIEFLVEDALRHGVRNLMIGGHWPCANAQKHDHALDRHMSLFHEAMNYIGSKWQGKFQRICPIMDFKVDSAHRTYVVDPISISRIDEMSQQQTHAPIEARA